eukprot:scaffold88625_cov36-Tisochrysis_lutea.AAC.1
MPAQRLTNAMPVHRLTNAMPACRHTNAMHAQKHANAMPVLRTGAFLYRCNPVPGLAASTAVLQVMLSSDTPLLSLVLLLWLPQTWLCKADHWCIDLTAEHMGALMHR